MPAGIQKEIAWFRHPVECGEGERLLNLSASQSLKCLLQELCNSVQVNEHRVLFASGSAREESLRPT